MKQEETILEDLMSQESLKRWCIPWVANPLVWTEVMASLIHYKYIGQMIKVITTMGRKALNNMKINVLCNIFQWWPFFMSSLQVIHLLKKSRSLQRFYACFMNHWAIWKN